MVSQGMALLDDCSNRIKTASVVDIIGRAEFDRNNKGTKDDETAIDHGCCINDETPAVEADSPRRADAVRRIDHTNQAVGPASHQWPRS